MAIRLRAFIYAVRAGNIKLYRVLVRLKIGHSWLAGGAICGL